MNDSGPMFDLAELAAATAVVRRDVPPTPQYRWPLLAELAEIRAGSPLFVDAYLLEARLTGRRFFETREAVDLDRSLALIDQALKHHQQDPHIF